MGESAFASRQCWIRAVVGLGAVLAALGTIGCSAHSKPLFPQFDRRPLYEQLGGEPGLRTIVDRFLRNMAANDEIAHHFKGIDARRFRDQLELHLCEVSDGPCRYEGESMREVHKNMGIDQRAFNAGVEDLLEAMEALDVPIPAQNRLIARLAPMRKDIVEGKRMRADSGHSANPTQP